MRVLVVVALAACGDNRLVPIDATPDAHPVCVQTAGTTVTAVKVATGCFAAGAPTYPDCVFNGAAQVTSPPGDSRNFIVELGGYVQVMENGKLSHELFLDISEDAVPPLVSASELGFLGLAFHPQFARNGEFFIFYSAHNTDPANPFAGIVKRYTIDPTTGRANPDSATTVLTIPKFAGNHNGGMIEFGPDGFLYIGTGDGGGGGDPQLNGQNPDSLLGKVLRIDVDQRDPGREYAIPVDNPFRTGGGAPEVFVIGLRNPWRFSFDDATGDLWIADVGQSLREEVDVLRPGQLRGANLGWSMFEGEMCFHPPCDATGKVMPVDTRTHADGWCSVIGGDVYRGGCYPDLEGWFFYSDFCKHGLSRARLRTDGSVEIVDHRGSFPVEPTSIHAGAFGELYLTDTVGNIYHLEAR